MTHATAWLILLAAGLLEIIWATSMKASAGFTRLPFTALTIAAAWTGIGAVGTAILGMAIFNEPAAFSD